MSKKITLKSDLFAANLLLDHKIILNEEFGDVLLLVELETNVDPKDYILEIYYKQPLFLGLLPRERTKYIILSDRKVQDLIMTYNIPLNETIKGQYPFKAKISSISGNILKVADFVLRYKLL